MTPSNPSPGWYPDPAGGGGIRYWDGRGWTTHVQPGRHASAQAPGWTPASGTAPGDRRPGAIAVGAALAAVVALLAVTAWFVIGAARGPGGTPVSTPRPTPPSSAVTTPSRTPSTSPSRTPGGVVPTLPAPTMPSPTLTIDTGCPTDVTGRLRSRHVTVTTPASWQIEPPILSFDCASSASIETRYGYAAAAVASVDADWQLGTDEVVDWVWQDLAVDAPYLEQRSRVTVDGHAALLVVRTLSEATRSGMTYDTTVRIAVIDAGGNTEVVVTDASVQHGTMDPDIPPDVAAIWRSVAIGG